MRLGFSLVWTDGYTRAASLRRAADVAMPTVSVGVILFVLAAMIEGFISPSALPYNIKAGVAVISSAMIMWYFVVLGVPRDEEEADGVRLENIDDSNGDQPHPLDEPEATTGPDKTAGDATVDPTKQKTTTQKTITAGAGST